MNKNIKDFNRIFWKIWGVNHRVYKPLDVFNRKEDKRYDVEKKHNNFLNNDKKLSNEEYVYHLNREAYNFEDLFLLNLFGNIEQVKFYVHQINNISYNYKIFQQQNFEKEKYVNLFSFQIALLLEHMNSNNIDTSMIDDSLKENSLMPFINKSKEYLKVKTLKDLSFEYSIINEKMQTGYKENNIYLEDVHADTFKKELSKWKNNKEYPSFVKMLVIINGIQKGNSEEKIGKFFQLLIARGLLHLQKEFNIDDEIRIEFIKQVSMLREDIRRCFNSNKDELLELQSKYVINMPFLSDDLSLNDAMKQVKANTEKFLSHNNGDDILDLRAPDRELIINTFNNCKNKQDYKKLLSMINDIANDKPHSQYINNGYNFIRFVISIKIEDKILFNKKYKYLDRGFGTLLSQGGINKELSEFSTLLTDKTNLVECLNLVGEHFKKLSTLE